jgi:carboxylesterase type B
MLDCVSFRQISEVQQHKTDITLCCGIIIVDQQAALKWVQQHVRRSRLSIEH